MVLPASAGMIPHAIHHTIMCAVVLPASAGMILKSSGFTTAVMRAPRIRGDDPADEGDIKGLYMCSPHPRG